MIISLLFAFIFASNVSANQAAKSQQKYGSEKIIMHKDHNFFKTLKTNINTKVNKIKKKVLDNINDIKTALGGNLRTALILMVIGLVFILLSGAVGGNVVFAVGAIFFIIGALFLLLYFI